MRKIVLFGCSLQFRKPKSLKKSFFTLQHLVAQYKKAKKLMKQAIWSTLPSGEFTAYQSDNPYQGMLIEPEPDLSPLEDRVWEVCTGRQIYYEELLKEIELIETIYLESHLNKLLRQLRSDGIVKVSGYEGRFAFNKNPLFEFPFFRL